MSGSADTAGASLAFDLGAESGRAILGRFDGRRLALEEIHRFETGGVPLLDRLYWDPLRLGAEIERGLSLAAQSGASIASVGIDTWGVDFALLAGDGSLLGNPRHYRDAHTDGMLEKAFEILPREQIFAHTGIQFMKLNSLYQLLALRQADSPQLAAAEQLLMIPDLLHYFLSGERSGEFSNATTTQLFDPSQGQWSQALCEAFDLPSHILPPIAAPGTQLGTIRESVLKRCGLTGDVPVILPATHDTGSAVAAVPAAGVGTGDFAYISSGTWSLMGAELSAPELGAEALRHNFTNEGGVGGTYRFLKNIMGLWLVQECRRTWLHEGSEFSYAELTQAAAGAPGLGALVDPDDERFMPPGDMPARIARYCAETSQNLPSNEGAIVRCVLDSLALKYRQVLEQLEAVLGRRLETIHIVGGGIQNELLCQLTADATGRPVVAGPAEATGIGNLLVQALGLGWVSSLADIRQVVIDSFEPRRYEPSQADSAAWDEAYGRFAALL
ncbi:MAG: rhamnulokinase [Gemmatimonadetes bacterium]|nr:rhamnulokinase [Gemmatimonadota bacterium]MBT6145250.1 rhamnulokinase [Gemmatimonadota bacterium]MBT7862389.1 rhamnulokinase [Gemmatimonadota bacterium]